MKKKYYWLRLKRDFFKRHDIRIVEEMENGKDYILFYLKLLCESVDHEGYLRFSDEIPYNEKMLSTITNTNIDIVRVAIKVFSELGMMDVMDDGTFFMSGVEKMIGVAEQDEHTRESTRLRVQACRERKKQSEVLPKRYSNVTCNGEIEIEKDINNKRISNDILRPTSEVERVVSEWNNLPEPIKKVKGLKPNTDRYKMLTARIKEYGIDDVLTAVRMVGESDFLRRGSDNGWTVDFGWFVRPNNFPKVLEGKYSNKGTPTQNYRTTPREKWDSYMWNDAIKDGYTTNEEYREWRLGHVVV